MKEYVGKICPYCKTAFTEEDDIVVCNSCEMPHHKSCWVDNKGCTTFGCLGTIDTPKTQAEETSTNNQKTENRNDIIYCSKCGAQNKQTDSFCSKCGNALHISNNVNNIENNNSGNNYNTNNTTNYNTYTTNNTNYAENNEYNAELARFIGENSQYYISKFNEMKRENKQTTWNWSAFLFTAYWLIYRKMYAQGVAVMAISFVISLIGGGLSFLLGLALDIAIGLYGNYIYEKQLQKCIAQSKNINEPYKTQYIAKNTGTNIGIAVAAVIGYVLIVSIIINM